MIKTNCPRSGLAQRWAPRLRTTFIVVLCFVILTLSLPLGASASSGTQMYDYNGLILPYSSYYEEYDYFVIYQASNGLYYGVATNNAVIYNITNGGFYFKNYYWIPITNQTFDSASYRSSSAMTVEESLILFSKTDLSIDGSVVIHGSSPASVQTQSTDYFITSEGNVHDLYSGETLQFYCQTTEGVHAESVTWSIQNVSDYTGLSISSSGLFSVSSESHSIGAVTVQASDINGTFTYCTFDLEIFVGDNPSSGSGGGEGSDDTSEPGNQEVIDEISQGVTDITDSLDDVHTAIVDTGNSIVKNVLEGLLRLFVPTSEELSAKMDDFKLWIDDNMPLLSVPISLVQYMYDMFFGVTPELGVLTFPKISWMNNVIIEETDLDLNQYTWLSDLLPIIRTVMTAGCALAFINWLRNKVGEVSRT